MQSNKGWMMISSIVISLGIFGAGFAIGKALYLSRLLNRVVTVKGMAERDVKSDLGVWEVDYREIGNNLTDINQHLNQDQRLVSVFLTQHGFTEKELEVQPVTVEDRLANIYASAPSAQTASPRYVVTSGIRVRSNNVDLIQTVSRLTNLLLQQGLPLAFAANAINPNPSYYFMGLDDIRPNMLADATRSARLVAEQFAKDADTRLNGISEARQGIFQIVSPDASSMGADWNSSQNAVGSIYKKVRLVTTVVYRLK